jgi:hypothetical protein
MNTISRTISGSLTIAFGVWFVVFLGFLDGSGIDFVALLTGLFFCVLGVVIFFNKKEDEIEKIKNTK